MQCTSVAYCTPYWRMDTSFTLIPAIFIGCVRVHIHIDRAELFTQYYYFIGVDIFMHGPFIQRSHTQQCNARRHTIPHNHKTDIMSLFPNTQHSTENCFSPSCPYMYSIYAYERIRLWPVTDICGWPLVNESSHNWLRPLVNESSRNEIKRMVSKIWTAALILYFSTRVTAVF